MSYPNTDHPPRTQDEANLPPATKNIRKVLKDGVAELEDCPERKDRNIACDLDAPEVMKERIQGSKEAVQRQRHKSKALRHLEERLPDTIVRDPPQD